MEKKPKVCSMEILLQYGKIFIFVWVMALTAQAANAQQATTDAEKAASDKRAQKVAQGNNLPKSISITEFRKLNATAKAPQNTAQQAPATGTNNVVPPQAAAAPVKVDTKDNPIYQSRSTSGSTNKVAAKTPPVVGNKTPDTKAPGQ